MSLLAHRIAREALMPPWDRTFQPWRADPPDLNGATCIDISGVYDLAYALASDVGRIVGTPAASALPSSRVWIEWAFLPRRIALFIESATSSDLVTVTEILDDPEQEFLGVYGVYRLRLSGEDTGRISGPAGTERSGWHLDGFSPENLVPAFLLLLNTPGGAGRGSVTAHGAPGSAAH